MKNVFFVVIIIALFTACGTSKTAINSKSVPVPPEGVTFTTIKNYKDFASIKIPTEGEGLTKAESGAYNDDGEMVPRGRFYGSYISVRSNLSGESMMKKIEKKNDVNQVFEFMQEKGIYGLKSYIDKENAVEKYSDVEIGGRLCKRYLISYNITKGDYSKDRYVFGYVIPYKETTAWLYVKDASCQPGQVDGFVSQLDGMFKYMIETVEFR